MSGLKQILLLLALFAPNLLVSQIIDTCQTNETAVYHVLNKNKASQLFFQVENAEVLSENPTKSDSVVVQWNSFTGVFGLVVQETSDLGCTGETYYAQVLIEEPLEPNEELVIPNIFTPNSDGLNDFFVIKSTGIITSYTIKIYTRSGTKVFESSQISNSWDGRKKGENCDPSVYYFIINYQSGSGVKMKKGFLHLLR